MTHIIDPIQGHDPALGRGGVAPATVPVVPDLVGRVEPPRHDPDHGDWDAHRHWPIAHSEGRDLAEAIVSAVRGPLVVIGSDMCIRHANRAFYHTFRVSPAETEGRDISDRGNGQWDVPALRSLLEDVILRGASLDDFEIDHDFPRIGRRVMLLNARRIALGDGLAPKALLAFEDVTDRRESERLRADHEAKLERSNRDLQDFAHVAAHDLQEPLRKIRTFGDRLAITCGPVLEGRPREYLAGMVDAATRMQALIDDVLAFALVTAQDRPPQPVDLGRIAREVLRDLEPQVTRLGAIVEVGELAIVEADPTQMRKLLQNLIANALKFHRPDEPPVIRLYALGRPEADEWPADPPGAGATCRFAIEDNGIGFDGKYGEKIFRIFERLHGASTYRGTGVGLAICRKIVDRHGGSISARSAPGRGATFLVSLPARQS